eukprot:TRINITY_DN60768_c0_g1_i1.p1 TRINITY_DN60768_c0_g1~~TRINITY_DN60768_c0_g1_i1.p1  ORF type:complete len:547 (-),score=73.69 TRINITY_DN60768_c0_g1_i1:107-1747(-)
MLKLVTFARLIALGLGAQPVVHTPLGSLRGTVVSSNTVGFFDIPYAEPITPERRFRKAVTKRPWSGVKDVSAPCTRKCIQKGGAEGEEDCLHLNLWAPLAESTTPLPVAVFIHGGSFTSGSGCLYDGQPFSEQGIIFITINYRLNILGFLQVEELKDEDPSWPSYGGMNGIADQIEALRWVQQNIVAFGGDPRKVTIWGESAGGESVCALMATPLAEGLFERAIIESGNCVTGGTGYGWGWGPGTIDEGLRTGRDAIAALNATSVSQVRSLDANEVVAKTPEFGNDGVAHSPFFVDGYVFSEHPFMNWHLGKIHGSALLTGGTSADGLLAKPYQDLKTNYTDDEIQAFFDAVFQESSSQVKQVYYSNHSAKRFSGIDAALIVTYRDGAVLCPSIMMARFATQAKLNTYFYGWGAPDSGAAFQKLYGLDHALPHALEMGAFGAPPGDRNLSALPHLWTQKTSQSVMEYWASFIKSGIPVDVSQRVHWPRFESHTRNAYGPYLYFEEDPPTVNGDTASADLRMPTAQDCTMWESLISLPQNTQMIIIP